jgi:hypothetical protein
MLTTRTVHSPPLSTLTRLLSLGTILVSRTTLCMSVLYSIAAILSAVHVSSAQYLDSNDSDRASPSATPAPPPPPSSGGSGKVSVPVIIAFCIVILVGLFGVFFVFKCCRDAGNVDVGAGVRPAGTALSGSVRRTGGGGGGDAAERGAASSRRGALGSSATTSVGRSNARAGATRRAGITSSAQAHRGPPSRSASVSNYTKPPVPEASTSPSSPSASHKNSSNSSTSSGRSLSRSASSTIHADRYQALLLRRTRSGDLGDEPLYQDLQLGPNGSMPGPLPAAPGGGSSPYYEDLQLAAPLPTLADGEVTVATTPGSPSTPTWPSPGTAHRASVVGQGSRSKRRVVTTPYGQMPSATEWAEAHEAEERQVAVATGSALGMSGRLDGGTSTSSTLHTHTSQYAAIPRRSDSRRAALSGSRHSAHSGSRSRILSSSTGSEVQRSRRL